MKASFPRAIWPVWLPALVLTAWMTGCSRGVRHPPPPIGPETTILAFGDSITAGSGAGRGEDYPSQLAAMLGCRVINAGRPGELSEEGLARLPPLLETHAPDLLILCHGGNDLLRGLPDDGIAARIDSMIALSLERGVPVVLLAVPRPGLRVRPPPFYRKIAAARGVRVIEDALQEVLTSGRLKSDLVHPNARGNRVIADAIARTLGAAQTPRRHPAWSPCLA